MSAPGDITQLLHRWTDGDDQAMATLSPMIYEELHRIAQHAFRGERGAHTLQATAVVHEAFEKLLGAEVSWENRGHFYALAARMMRRLLIDHATARSAGKRGSGQANLTLDENLLEADQADEQLLDLNEALTALGKTDERKLKLVELQYFAGLTFEEMALATGLSTSTLDRELRLARAWLKDWLDHQD